MNDVEPMDFEVGPAAARKIRNRGRWARFFAGQTALVAENAYQWEYEPVEKKISMNFLLAIMFGFIAGIILNVMPCVLPVLGIKILSLAKAGGASRKTVLARSLVFSSGIMTVFMALAAFASFAQLSWGQQFQSPWFLVSLIVLTVVFALGLFDVYVLVVPSNISNLERKSGKGLWVNISAACSPRCLPRPAAGRFSAPRSHGRLRIHRHYLPGVFLHRRRHGVSLRAFSLSKTLVNLIPKPGKWMEDFKHLMGILLLGAAVYFLLGLPKTWW